MNTAPSLVTVIDVTQENDRDYVVLLLQKELRRVMGVWVGYAEMGTLSWLLEGRPWIWQAPRRPLTFDFIARLMSETGIFLREIEIISSEDHLYIAAVRIQAGHEELELDARPSDAMALALTLKRPIYASVDAETTSSWPVHEIYPQGDQFGQGATLLQEGVQKYWEPCADRRVMSNTAPRLNLPPKRKTTPCELKFVDILKKDAFTNVVILLDEASDRILPIQIALWDTWNLVWYAGEKPWPEDKTRRPYTFELCADLLAKAGFIPDALLLNKMREDIFLASFALTCAGQPREIDARPIDGLLLALETGVPIYVSEWILEAAGEPIEARYRNKEQIGRSLKLFLRDLKIGYGIIREEKTLGEKISQFFRRRST